MTPQRKLRFNNSSTTTRVLDFIRAFYVMRGTMPTIREIAAELDASSSVAAYHVERLIRFGALEKTPNVARGLHLTARRHPTIPLAAASKSPPPARDYAERGWMPASRRRILRFMVAHWREHQVMPSVREIAAGTGYRSPSSIYVQLRRMEQLGWLTLPEAQLARSIRLTARGLKEAHKR